MIWTDATFPYDKYKGQGNLFDTFMVESYEDEDDDYAEVDWQLDHSEKLGMYRITKFKDNHWCGDVVFDEYTNAYCPLCDAKRYIPVRFGYCCVCGHALDQMEGIYE